MQTIEFAESVGVAASVLWLFAWTGEVQLSFGATGLFWGLCTGAVGSVRVDPAAGVRGKCAGRANTYNLPVTPTADAEVGALQGLQ